MTPGTYLPLQQAHPKPLIKLLRGLYYCGIKRNGTWRAPVGVGYTREQAYEDWKRNRV